MYDINTPATSPIIWPFVVLGILIFIIWSENGSQNLFNRSAHHQPPVIENDDRSRTILDKTLVAVQNQSNVVGWRRALFTSLILTLLFFGIVGRVFPTGFSIFLVGTLFFVAIYFSSIWVMSRWYQPNNRRITQELLQLRSKL